MKSSYQGDIVEAIQKSTGTKVIIKRVEDIFSSLDMCKRLIRELTLLRKLKHLSLNSIIDIIEPSNIETFNTIYVVMDYGKSNLGSMFRSPIYLQNIHIQHIMYNILLGIKYLHSAQMLHGNLNPSDVLINEDCSVKICNFKLDVTAFNDYNNFVENREEENNQKSSKVEEESKEKVNIKPKRYNKHLKLSHNIAFVYHKFAVYCILNYFNNKNN